MLGAAAARHSGSLEAVGRPVMPLLLLKIKILPNSKMYNQYVRLMTLQGSNYSQHHIGL